MADLTDHSTNDIDLICNSYRQQWSPENSGPGGVIGFLKTHRARKDDKPLIVRLIQTDLEKVWSHWAEWVESQAKAGAKADTLLSKWKLLPRLQNYGGLFVSSEEMGLYWSELANVESQCRDRWGDAVGPTFYEHHYQVKTDEYLRRTRRHMRCEFDSNDEYSEVLFPLRGLSEVGRQRTRDNQPYFFQPKPEGNRIVVASRYEAEVSREQLTIQLLSPMVAIVTNRSTVNPIRISPDILLPCEQQAAVLFSFTIQLPGRRLSCY